MKNICPSCGGVIGRDCFNIAECAQITASLNQPKPGESDAVEFAEWNVKAGWVPVMLNEIMYWYIPGITPSDKKLTTSELYKLFKDEKDQRNNEAGN